MTVLSTVFSIITFSQLSSAIERLTIDKSTKTFKYNGNTVFLNGANQPWDQYGNDFGNNQSNGVFCNLNYTLANLTANSGNSVREWLFIGGDSIPQFDSNGNVIATDAAGSLIKDLTLYLEAAAAQNIFIFFSLWNGAVAIPDNEMGLMMDTKKLQTFIDNALTPVVKALAGVPGLGGYEIINEPCGSIKAGLATNNNCTDTTRLKNTGAGWTNMEVPMSNMQQFVNLQVAAIHEADPDALVTVGIWNEQAGTDEFGYFNYFKDECLISAGGKQNGVLDFQQLHTYAFNGKYDTHSPIYQVRDDFGLDIPLVIGEFENQLSAYSYPVEYNHFYNSSYNGAWAWAMNTNDANGWKNIDTGVAALKGKPGIAVDISIDNPPSGRCWCSDVPPQGQYTCQQQAGWGKCNETWMAGLCCQSCHACQGCI